jgi:hypothetical protein
MWVGSWMGWIHHDGRRIPPERQLEESQRHGSSFKNGVGDGRGGDRRQSFWGDECIAQAKFVLAFGRHGWP